MRVKMLIAAVLMAAAPMVAADTATEEAIEYRQSMFKGLSWHLGPMADMARRNIPFDRETFEHHAKRLYQLSLTPWEGFIEGSYNDGDFGEITSASGDIHHQGAIFERMAANLAQEAGVLAQVASSSDASERAIVQQFARTAQTCRSCHDDYRAR